MVPQGCPEEDPSKRHCLRFRAIGPFLRLLRLHVLRRVARSERGPGVQEGVQVRCIQRFEQRERQVKFIDMLWKTLIFVGVDLKMRPFQGFGGIDLGHDDGWAGNLIRAQLRQGRRGGRQDLRHR